MRALQRSDGSFVSPDATEPLFARSRVLIDRLLSNPMFTVQGVRVEHLPGKSARSTFGLREEDVALSFIAEMLHYLRREAHLFPDSAAACVELNYLVRHEHLRVNEDLSLNWSPQSLRTGFEALAQELVQYVLGGAPEAAGRFLGRYGSRSMWARGATRIEPLLHMLSYQLPHIPTIATA